MALEMVKSSVRCLFHQTPHLWCLINISAFTAAGGAFVLYNISLCTKEKTQGDLNENIFVKWWSVIKSPSLAPVLTIRFPFLSAICFHAIYLYVPFFQNVIDRKPYPEDENLVEVKFATTPIMSTYLVAFVIGEYDYVESQSSDGITVRVYTPVGKAEQGKFALEVRMLSKDFYNISRQQTTAEPAELYKLQTWVEM